ncbi:hypothetical protein [Escherichia coli]|uniref:hypothetical protein n=1 Tax=Escherichia coli TaxID=562 RepID=UPI000CFA9FEE|nr:hypothetical protein [Escherichia coli]
MIRAPFDNLFLEKLEQDKVEVIIAAKLELSTGTVRLCSGTGTVVIAGQHFIGIGGSATISAVTEKDATNFGSVVATLNGFDPRFVGDLLKTEYAGCRATLYITAMENGLPVTTNGLFDGIITDMAIHTGENSAMSISISSIFNSWLKGFPARYTEESHSANNENDRFFKYVDQVASRPIIWEV